MLVRLSDAHDPRLADYRGLTDVALRRRLEPEAGLFMAESRNVIRRAVGAGHRPRSFLMAERWLPTMADIIAAAPGCGGDPEGGAVPVMLADEALLREITGYNVHRGALAAMHRPELPGVEEVLAGARGGAGARRVAVLEDMVDHTNVGAVFRSAAGLGVDAVLVTPSCADPFYRRSVRVSMGTVFQVPWTRTGPWPREGIELLAERGFTVAALALDERAVALDALGADPPERLALVLGAEGDGLRAETVARCDLTVRIPMAGAVDSLNVAAASAVAFWETRVV